MSPFFDDPMLQARIRRFAEEAEEEPGAHEAPRRFRRRTILLLLVLAGCAWLVVAFYEYGEPNGPFLLGLFGALGVTAPALFCLRTDLRVAAPSLRTSPEQPVDIFFAAIAHRQWERAHRVLSPLLRDRLFEAPLRDEPFAEAKLGRLDTPGDLRQHWEPLVGSYRGFDRRITKVEVSLLGSDGPLRKYLVRLSIQRYPSWSKIWFYMSAWSIAIAHAEAKKQSVSFEVATIKHRSEWWLVSGDFPPKDDSRFRGYGDLASARVIDRDP